MQQRYNILDSEVLAIYFFSLGSTTICFHCYMSSIKVRSSSIPIILRSFGDDPGVSALLMLFPSPDLSFVCLVVSALCPLMQSPRFYLHSNVWISLGFRYFLIGSYSVVLRQGVHSLLSLSLVRVHVSLYYIMVWWYDFFINCNFVFS